MGICPKTGWRNSLRFAPGRRAVSEETHHVDTIYAKVIVEGSPDDHVIAVAIHRHRTRRFGIGSTIVILTSPVGSVGISGRVFRVVLFNAKLELVSTWGQVAWFG